MDRQPRPWDQQPGDENHPKESAKAYAAFFAYLEMGAARSVDKTYQRLKDKPPGTPAAGYFKKWSRTYTWRVRAEAFDTHELAEKMAAREQVREQFRQDLIDRANELKERAFELALGKGKVDNGRVNMINSLLDRAGLAAPKQTNRLEVSGPEGGPIRTENGDIRELLEGLTDEDLEALEALADRFEAPSANPGRA